MGYKKCPICELNYISDEEEMCEVCRGEKERKGGSHGAQNKKGTPPGETLTFTITNVKGWARGKHGFFAYDQSGRNIGIVYMQSDKRAARYEMAELCFYEKYESEFGAWRIIKQNGSYLPYERLEAMMKTQDKYVCTTDAR